MVGSRDGALGLGKSCFVRAVLSYAQAVRDFVTAMRNFVAALRIREPVFEIRCDWLTPVVRTLVELWRPTSSVENQQS